MEFNWTTFALEILNFLVLIWILAHFLYRPVRQAVLQRQGTIAASLEAARNEQAAAEALKQQYDRRAADWEAERLHAREQLADEIAAERARLMADVRQTIALEHQKDQALQQRRMLELRQHLASEAVGDAVGFAARLLTRLADAALERRICELLMEDLSRLPEEQLRALRQACVHTTPRVTSAYACTAAMRAAVEAALSTVVGSGVVCEFELDPRLIAGLRVSAGAWVLRCNLADELAFFAEAGTARVT